MVEMMEKTTDHKIEIMKKDFKTELLQARIDYLREQRILESSNRYKKDSHN